MKVRKTSRSWIVHVGVVRGASQVEVANLALNVASRVRDALVSKYACILGSGEIVAGELAQDDPVATLFGRYFSVRTDRRKIDHSWNKGELEHLQRDAVIDYMQMPETVKRLELELSALRCEVKRIADCLEGRAPRPL